MQFCVINCTHNSYGEHWCNLHFTMFIASDEAHSFSRALSRTANVFFFLSFLVRSILTRCDGCSLSLRNGWLGIRRGCFGFGDRVCLISKWASISVAITAKSLAAYCLWKRLAKRMVCFCASAHFSAAQNINRKLSIGWLTFNEGKNGASSIIAHKPIRLQLNHNLCDCDGRFVQNLDVYWWHSLGAHCK